MNLDLRPEDKTFEQDCRTIIDTNMTEDMRLETARGAGVWAEFDLGMRWQKILYQHGLIAPSWPKAYGGCEWSLVQRYIWDNLCAEFGAPRLPAMGLRMCGPVLMKYGTNLQKDRFLPRILSGEDFWCQGYSEPGAGSDLAALKCRAVRDGDDYVINGQKVFITNGGNCDVIVLACKTDPSQGSKGTSLILVPADTPGFRKGNRLLEKVGWKAQDTAELFFDDVRVPVGNLLGEEGRGFVQMMEQLPQERLMQCVRAASTLEAAITWTTDHVKERKAFGGTIADFQNTRFRLAEAQADAVMLRVFVDRCLEAHEAGELDAVDAAMGKMLSSETLCRHLDALLQLFGGYGYMWEYPIARAYADARVQRIYGGTSEIMKEIISRGM